MIAAIATIAFLAAAWAAIVAIAGSLEANLKVSASLRREIPALTLQSVAMHVSPRYSQARSQRAQARPARRAAA